MSLPLVIRCDIISATVPDFVLRFLGQMMPTCSLRGYLCLIGVKSDGQKSVTLA